MSSISYLPDFSRRSYQFLPEQLSTETRKLLNSSLQVGPVSQFHWLNFDMEIDEGVFVPSSSTTFLAQYLRSGEVSMTNKKILVIGCGAGPEVLVVAEQNPSILCALDIDLTSVQCTAKNLSRNLPNSGIKTEFLVSNKCAELREHVYLPFDFIICNPPAVDLTELDAVRKRIAFCGSEFVVATLTEIFEHGILHQDGIAVFALSNTSNLKSIFHSAAAIGFIPYVLASISYPPPYHETVCILLALIHKSNALV
jgi:tRNA1(Val) A37 N6-methylase TrmN6